jgi:hypothetical protein
MYEGISKIFRIDGVKIMKTINKHMWKLPTSTHLRATRHTDSLDMVVLPSTDALRCHNCCIDGGTSPEYFGCTLVFGDVWEEVGFKNTHLLENDLFCLQHVKQSHWNFWGVLIYKIIEIITCTNMSTYLRSEVVTVVWIKTGVFWDVVLCQQANS